MDKEHLEFFNLLSAKRAKDANALEGFALRGVKNSVVEKYSDQAHFIYELLQNADDAKATTARFELQKDRLIFAHNGTRRFNVSDPTTEESDQIKGKLGDINAITAVGSSNKIDKATIGKFGVGFKAVFQYTATPHIYDPNVFFKMERFIVPIRLETDHINRKDEETLFVFPFDHENRSAKEAYSDISEKLRSLDYPLLFLSNLKDISFEISTTLGLYGKVIEKKSTVDNTTVELISLTQNDDKNRDELYEHTLWMFSREDSDGHKYSVGFFVGNDGHLIPKSHTAFCFFPTRETTGLNFIIHAPFLLTDSREGIRAGIPHNNEMILLLSRLAADSLTYLKNIGQEINLRLINDDIFDIVPYDDSTFSDVNNKNRISFKPFYTVIKEAFLNDTIIPCSNGYVSSGNAYWAFVPQIAELFSSKQLSMITHNNSAEWVFTSFGRQETFRKNRALTNYIESIINVWLDEDDILNGWSFRNGSSYDGITSNFIELQSIEWLHKLYKWVSETKTRTEIVKTKPIFLDQDGNASAAFDLNDQAILFLPTEGGSGYKSINSKLLQNEETFEFINKIGVTEPSLKDEIYNIILPLYKADNITLDTRTHFKKFFQYYQKCSQTDVQSFLALIRDYAFIWYQSDISETIYLGRASNLYFPSDHMRKWFQIEPETRFVCFDEYIHLVGEDNKEILINFFIDLGVKNMPRIFSHTLSRQEAFEIQNNWPRSTGRQSWVEKHIDGCKELLAIIYNRQDIELSVFIWSQLLKFVEYGYLKDNSYWSRDSILFGRYNYFYYQAKVATFESSEAKRLRTYPWLANSSEQIVPANKLTVQTIHPQYDVSSDEAIELLRILGVEDVISETDDEDDNISSYAERLGLTEEEQRQALLDFAKRKQATESAIDDNEGEDFDENSFEEPTLPMKPSVERVVKEIAKRATSKEKKREPHPGDDIENAPTDEDDYSKPTVDISDKIEKHKERAEREIEEIVRLEELKQQAQDAERYSYAWFKALLDLESTNSNANNSNSREISISFSKVELEEGTSRTLVLKHPNRYIPQFMEDLADIPLELHFASDPTVRVAVEVVNVKSYTLRAKLRTNAEINSINLSLVTEARIEAKNPVFLIEELRKSFSKLGDDNEYSDAFNMQQNLCENVEFVFGPPGTGKTTHLARNVILPKMRETEDLKILVLTPTNKAADVLVNRLMESMEDDSYLDWLVRFGATNDRIIEQSGVLRDKTFDIRTFPKNVTVTTIARFPYDYFLPDNGIRLHLSALKWDYIIIDEASMIPLANIVYPLYKKTPRKFIIAGDPFQIEPITTVDIWKNENIYTMVQLDSFSNPNTVPHPYHVELLTTQYRSIPEIGEVFSNFAYDGVLNHFRSSDSQRVLPIGEFIDLKALNVIKFPVSKYESIYRPKRLQGKTPYQVYSALFAFEFVKFLSLLIEQAVENEFYRIGLIAPYRAQSDLINKLMTSITLPKDIDVQVGTIHGFQGDECDIIVALFNPPPYISSSKEMFLNKLNIINVSISRARDYLFILMPDDNTENINKLALVKKVEYLCKQQLSWNEQFSPNIEEVMFDSKTYIEDNSFSTSHQLVNVYRKPEKQYEIRSEDNAIDVQIHEEEL